MANTERVKTMRAAVRDSLGNVVMQSAVAVPTPAKGQVLIRVRAAAYNQIDHKYGPFGGRVPGQVLPPHTSPDPCFVQVPGRLLCASADYGLLRRFGHAQLPP